MFSKFRWNFVFVVLIIAVIAFIILDVLIYFNLRNYLFEQTFDELKMKTDLSVTLLEQKNVFAKSKDESALTDYVHQLKTMIESRVTIIDSTGRVLADSDVSSDSVRFMDNHSDRPEVQAAMAYGWGQSYRSSDTVKRKFFYTAHAIHYAGKTHGFLRLAYYAHRFEGSMRKILSYIFAANLIGLIALFLSALSIGSLVTIPILRIVTIARQISEGDLKKTFPVQRKDEIGTLSLYLNQLTERLQDQIRLISSERSKFLNILMNMDVGIIALDEKKNILHINPELFEILKMKPTDTEHVKMVHILRSEHLLESIEKTLATGSKETGEIIFFIENGKIFLNYVVTPLFVAEEKKSGALIQIQDVTNLRQLEAIRRTFVANASHELKTPLTAIVGYAETILEGTVSSPESQMKFIRRIREQAQRLEYLVGDLLKLSQIEHDIPLELKTVQLIPLLRQVIADYRDKSEQKKIRVHIESSRPKIMVKADEELLRTVFSNLIDNAIKYTPEKGTVTIQIFEGDDRRLAIEVKDTGIGIDPKYHDRIFQRFYRVDKARSRELGGTGLGLSIVKHILERHETNIFVRSQLNQGSCFCFYLKKAES